MNFTEVDYKLVAGHYDKMVPWDVAWASSVAIFKKRGISMRIHGSGTLFQIADERFVITAAHVLDDHQGQSLLLPADGTNFVPFEGEGIVSTSDAYDVAALHRKPEHADRIEPSRFLRLGRISASKDCTQGLFAIVGFPEMLSEQDGTNLKVIKYFHMASTWEGDNQSLANFDERVHFHIDADLSEVRNQNGEPIRFNYPGGQPAPFPQELKGISGGAVWKIADTPYDTQTDSSKARLVGVEIAVFQKSKCIRATKWNAVIQMIVAAFPSLKDPVAMWRPT